MTPHRPFANWPRLVILLPVLALAIIFYHSNYASELNGPSTSSKAMVVDPMAFVEEERGAISRGLALGVKNGLFTLADLENLDFSVAGDPTFGSKPDLEVFNPQGKLFPCTIGTPDGKSTPCPPSQHVLDPDWMDALTTDRTTRPLFNLDRVVDSHKDTTDTLYMIIPNMKVQFCQKHKEAIQHYAITIASDNHRPTPEPPGPAYLNGCIGTPDGKHYLFLSLISRFKTSGSTQWQTKP